MVSRLFVVVISMVVMACNAMASQAASSEALQSLKIATGKLIFNDANLSEPAGQSCNTCHQSDNFHADPGKMVSPGANPELFGNRNAPSISYVKFTPSIYWDKEEEHWVGGFFLDGRANTLQDQAEGPFTNLLEMGNQDVATLIAKVKQAAYAPALEQLYGEAIWSDNNKALKAVTEAIVAYENGPEFASFTSKYDYYLQGKVDLTALEKKGLELFEAEDKGNCAACHPNRIQDNGELPLFTDYTYDNLGLARPDNLPFYAMPAEHNPQGSDYIDYGLAENPLINNGPEEKGKFKVSTLRNIANTAPYMHNGIFNTLDEVVDFYNSRDIKDKWGKPELQDNLNEEELGDLKLTDDEMRAIVAFMETLSDGFQLDE